MKFLIVVSTFLIFIVFSSQDEFFENNVESLEAIGACPANSQCSLRMPHDFGNPQPLYIRPGTTQLFHPNDNSGQILMDSGDEIEIFCNQFTSPAGFSGSIVVECVSGTIFRHNGFCIDFKSISCSSHPMPVNIVRETENCFNNSLVVDVGFQVDTRFLNIYTSCHDPVLHTNYYTNYEITPISVLSQTNVGTIAWRQHSFFPGKNVDGMMTIVNQRKTVGKILNSEKSGYYFIRSKQSQKFLARGHMAARTDFIYGPEQRASFTFVNFAPQYQSFNARNWLAVEIGTRRLAADRNITLDTFTGIHGVTHFWNEKGDRRQIFIGWPQRSIPVPKIFYKIIINRANQSGIVFIGVNNIFLTLDEIQKDYMYCEDISDRVNYINWNRSDIFLGYSYACDVNEFLRAVPHIPGLRTSSLLL